MTTGCVRNHCVNGFLAMSVLMGAGAAFAQPPQPSAAVIPPQDLVVFCQHLTTLMDAGGVSVPDLQRAAAPVIEADRKSTRLNSSH